MWTSAWLKQRAKFFLKHSYTNGVLAQLIYFGISLAFILPLEIISIIFMTFKLTDLFESVSLNSGEYAFSYDFQQFFVLLAGLFVVIYILTFVFYSLVLWPLQVGICHYSLRSRHEKALPRSIFFAFKKGVYSKVTVAMLWNMLFQFLWALPLLVSEAGLIYIASYTDISFELKLGLILFFALAMMLSTVVSVYKTISYSQCTFILCDNPAIGCRRALKLSMAFTRGQEGHIFLLGLSFIGWMLLGALTSIGYIFLMPYVYATEAELYAVLRHNALQKKLCSFSELNFAEPEGFYTQQ